MRANSRLSMTMGLANHAAVRALTDGRVQPDGIDLTVVSRFPEPWMVIMGQRIISGEIDGGEFSLSMLIQSKAMGMPIVGIPVFPFRSFRHRSIYLRDGSGIKTPSDLKGKRMGVHHFVATNMAWVRGMLREEYGIQPRDMRWYTLIDKGAEGARKSGVSIEVLEHPPAGVGYIEHIANLIQAGELDGGILPVDPARPGIQRLFPEFAGVEASYYRRTRIFPILHTIALNGVLVEDHPWVKASLLEAFRKSAGLAGEYLTSMELEDWDKEMWGIDKQIIGGKDPYACGIGPEERRTIEALEDYLLLEGAISRKLAIEDIFPPL